MCVGGQECRASLATAAFTSGREKQPEKQLWTTLLLPLHAPFRWLPFKLSLKRPRDYVLAEANIYILGRRLLGIYNGRATQTRCQDACVLVPVLKQTQQFPDISAAPVLFGGSEDLWTARS